jgi:hypothetical protein
MLSRYKTQMLKLLEDNIFDDSEIVVSITYTRYKGRDTAAQTFTISDAARIQHDVVSEELDDGVMVQRAQNMYIIKESSLPSGVTVADLTKNDKITDGSVDYLVSEIDKTLEFVIQVVATGSQ